MRQGDWTRERDLLMLRLLTHIASCVTVDAVRELEGDDYDNVVDNLADLVDRLNELRAEIEN